MAKIIKSKLVSLYILVAFFKIIYICAQLDRENNSTIKYQSMPLWNKTEVYGKANNSNSVIGNYSDENRSVDNNINDNSANDNPDNDKDNDNYNDNNGRNIDYGNDDDDIAVVSTGNKNSFFVNIALENQNLAEVEEKVKINDILDNDGSTERSERKRRSVLSAMDAASALNYHNLLRRKAGSSNMQILVSFTAILIDLFQGQNDSDYIIINIFNYAYIIINTYLFDYSYIKLFKHYL